MEQRASSGRLLDGRYRLGRRIARGGMASVYEAVDTRLDRTVAVKVMHADLSDGPGAADRDFAERFVREAQAAARLNHPNVVQVHDQGDDDGTLFLVMELVSGHTLRDTIASEAPLPPARALQLLEPVLAALAAAHRAGLVHRDVKPENVLVSRDPATGAEHVTVADFGLARAVSADTRHTATQGVLIGTVGYLAPELVVDGRADQRADVYAVGVLLYELLTAELPHRGESPIQVAYRHVHHDVPAPSLRTPGLPPYVDALVARATARDRTRRPADAAVMLHQLHRAAQALADGVRDDPELTADLAPPPDRTVETEALDEAWDEGEVRELLAAGPAVRERATVPPSPPPLVREPVRSTRTVEAEPWGSRQARPTGTARPAEGTRPTGSRQARPTEGARPTGRRGPLLLVAALVLALAVGGGAFWWGWARYDAAPSVGGSTRADAVETLEGAGLEVAFADAVWDGDVPKGAVVEADPRGGEQVLPGDTVTLVLSLGPLRVPRVRGLDEDAAQDALLARDLDFGESVARYSETVDAGTVLSSRPRRGTELRPGAGVDLVVSRGRRPIPVGRWVGESADDAREALEGRGLVVDTSPEEFSTDVAAGDVVSQTPARGTLFRGEVVTLVVSKGPELVAVPDVDRFGIDAARSAVEDAGLILDVEQAEVSFGLGFVVGTDPGAGTMVPLGSTVTVYVV